MNLFASDVYLEALARAYHRGRDYTIETVGLEGLDFRLLRIGRRRWITDWPFLDFHEPLGSSNGGASRRPVRWIRKVSLGPIDHEGWQEVRGTPGHAVAPYIDWTAFESFEGFLDHVRSLRKRQWKNIENRRRKLEREVGPVEVRLQDDDPFVVDLCLEWKARRSRRTGFANFYRHQTTGDFFRALARGGLLEVSSVRVSGRPAAIHMGARFDGRFYAWIPAYEGSLFPYAPGLVLFHELMEASFRAGDRAFDFLIGDEEFKWYYANGARLLGPLGRPAAATRLWRGVRGAIGSHLRRRPGIYRAANAARRYVESVLPVHS